MIAQSVGKTCAEKAAVANCSAGRGSQQAKGRQNEGNEIS